MRLNRRSAVIGSAARVPVRDDRMALEELLYAVSQEALADAGLTIDDIDGIVVASNDQFDGRAISVMAASGSVGGVERDILSTPSGSEHAFVMAVLRIASVQYETHLVVSWSPTEASSLSEAERLGADPYFHRRLPLDEASSFALQACALSARNPEAHALAEQILSDNRRNGAAAHPDMDIASPNPDAIRASKPLRWPLREGSLPKPVGGVVALVLASEDYVDRHRIENVAYVTGLGWATEPGFLGDRDLAGAPALKEAARLAYDMAGIGEPRSEFDVVEISDATAYQQLIAYENLGLSEPSRWQADVETGFFAPHGKVPVNLSGGISSLNPVFCTGLMRICEAARQVRGSAGAIQKVGVDKALAHAASGFAMMYQTVVVLEKGASA